MTHETLIDVLNALRPGAQWVLRGATLADLEWLDANQAEPTAAEIDAEIARQAVPPALVLSQDLMAQFTEADAGKIRAAVNSNAQFWLLWSAMQAQKDPMQVTNARFLAGWSALVQVLGADRMAAIAAALGVTV